MRPSPSAKGASAPVQEVPETEEQKLLRAWVALLQALDTQVKIIPDDSPELFEDREIWTRGWSKLQAQLGEAATTAAGLKVELELDDAGREILEEGKRAYKAFSREIREMKDKAIADPLPKTPPRHSRSLQKLVAEVVLPVPKDSGKKPAVVRSSTRKSAPPPISCARCSLLTVLCDGKPGKRCPRCASAKKPCSFSRKKTKKNAAPRKAGSAPDASLPAASASGSIRRTILSVAQDAMDITTSGSGESEVENDAEEKEVPICAVKALPSRALKVHKGKGNAPSVPTEGAEEVEDEVERLKAENQHLKSIILSMRQSGRSQQSRLIALSHQAYSMSTELVRLDEELAFLD
ncbi:hypothetical protein DFJ58DRAFT_911238 [Suillus subalutaceus]|uniref:uncharacterized protein n=1 Tax=Suillus subalutaceus TaxID=48586 RepID=UPI001B862DB3|nr:uncharacterized protein DFJ58DRAFT_911238 [Suillus subalutaceus]KAG1869357.1 hypothetical protein DFJ58DRAFT_911238 [Suillus subalutaceus]